MKRKNYIDWEGTIIEALPNGRFNVRVGTGEIIKAHPSGKLRMNFIHVWPGDRVLVRLEGDSSKHGRIIRRLV